jgi:hypothetical protein
LGTGRGGIRLLEKAGVDIRQSPGLRVGVLVCDDHAWCFAPTALYLEEQPHSDETPNAVQLLPQQVAAFVRAICPAVSAGAAGAPGREIGIESLSAAELKKAEEGLNVAPPLKFDVCRQVRVFQPYIQYVELSLKGCSINLSMLNDRLTQLRQRKETLERQLASARASGAKPEEESLRQWARERIGGLVEAIGGRRDLKAREVLASYVERIVVTPSTKSGVMFVNPAVGDVCGYKENDRSGERSCAMLVAGAGFEPATFGL